MSQQRPLVWSPSPKQGEFLSASESEVLYGGAAGGGKSDALLIDALGLNQSALEVPSYQAILFRRTFPELRDLVDRSQAIYNQFCPAARYNQTEHVWTFPSGAKIELGHMQHENDRFKYRGRAFQYIGWDELTLFPSDVVYGYLQTRLRTVESRLQCYVRATTNPDGPGQKWVKAHWAIDNAGGATRFEVRIKDEETGQEFIRTRRFIPARLDDNPYLTATPDYRINLLSRPAEEREALLRGRWDAVPLRGAYYSEAMATMRREGRICKVPWQKNVPVDTYWDLGYNDTTAIVWHQQVALQDRFLRGYENSGESLDHYAKIIKDQPYIYGTHFLPHDAEYIRMGKDRKNTQSWRSMLEALLPGHQFEIIPRVEDVSVGIEQTRNVFPSAWIDEIECAGLISALDNYRKEWDQALQVFRDRPLHDWASNYADAYRQFGQRRAEAPHRAPDYELEESDSWKVV